MTSKEQSNQESFKVSGDEILAKIKEIIKEGNARKSLSETKKTRPLWNFL